ncbi:MAG: magnesium-translocating P-type ATPase [Burkholderiaceae bacterium]|nr:magnesium-translocating P-type ATPase [Burkholderiaceae bacterium]
MGIDGTGPAAPGAPGAWWSQDAAALFAALGSEPRGLSAGEAQRRLAAVGPNTMVDVRVATRWQLLGRQLASPLTLILVAGAAISLGVGEWIDALTILLIIAIGTGIGFVQELRAGHALQALRRRLAIEVQVRRPDGMLRRAASLLVPGDVIELSAGNLVPADGLVLQARDFLVDQSSLTGESLPVEKRAAAVPADAALNARTNAVFLGSSVRSGTAAVLVVSTGRATAMAGIAARIAAPDEQTQFERGVRRFGDLLLRVMVGVVVGVLLVNQLFGQPGIHSALFAVALAVGLSPELLPAIVSVSLARGARRLARGGVLVRRLDAIEDLGGIDTLCTDKTGTLTLGVMALDGALDARGHPSAETLQAAWLNAAFETGIRNPIDAALVQAGRAAGLSTDGWVKVDEIPYDFVRRRLTIVLAAAADTTRHRLISKGACAETLAACTQVRDGGQAHDLDDAWRGRLQAFVQGQGERGVRVLAVAVADRAAQASWGHGDESGLTLIGFLCFSDPPKPDAREAISALAGRGVRVKMITGDNRHVAAHLAREVGLDAQALLTGAALDAMRDEALWALAERTDLFVEVDPAQKERIVRALQRTGHAVGYLGDGINDAPALHAADVGISVHGAADVARESADIVLLGPDLGMLRRGLEEGRRTFANTLKYIYITTSANFGNMVSMALATPLLPFLPLTATQILLNNLLSDVPSMAISTDRVDAAAIERVPRWDMAEVRRFMIVFGLVSSAFDLAAFALLRLVFDADAVLFHSAWFVMSLLTELVVLLVLRTREAAWRSAPSGLLAGLTVAVAAIALGLPHWPWSATLFGLTAPPLAVWGALLALVCAYGVATEITKRWFFRSTERGVSAP